MDVTNNDGTVINTVDRLQITSTDCRICFEKCAEVWQIFHPANEEIPRKLMEFAAVQVEEGDGLPATMCQNCRRLLDIAYDFKCQVEQSDAKLREILMGKESSEEDEKMLALSQSVNVVITEGVGDERNHGSERLERMGATSVETTRRSADGQNEHRYACHGEPIILGIEPPSDRRESRCGLERTLTEIRSKVCSDADEKAARRNDLDDDRVGDDGPIERYDELAHTNIDGEPYESGAMVISEDESPEEGNDACIAASMPEAKNIAAHSAETKSTKASTIDDDDEDDDDDDDDDNDDNNDDDDDDDDYCSNFAAEKKERRETDDEEKAPMTRTQRLKCSNCIKTFATQTSLERHAAVHNKKNDVRYVCHVCAKNFGNLKKMKSHLSSSHGDRTLSDEEISEIVGEATKTYKQRVGSENGKKNMKFSCKICGKRFTYEKSFLTHAKSHPGYESETIIEKEESKVVVSLEECNEREHESEDDDMPLEGLQCTQCGKLFATKRNLKRHLSTHSGFKFHCSTCSKEFSRIDKLKEHEQSKHKDELFASSDPDSEIDTDSENRNHDGSENRKKDKCNRPHQCPMCPKAFAQEQSLTNHMERHKRVKDTQKRFLCEVCSKCFAQSGSLVAHMRTHTGVKPYVCNVCSRAFTKSTYLQLHLRTHSGEKPYICQYCSRAFARANTLARHITMHTGEAKYHCQICMKSFRRLTSLNEHTYTHTGQRPYACKICTKRYNNAGSLYAHTKKCKAQQSSGTITTYALPPMIEEEIRQNGETTPPQMLIYSQRKLSEASSVEQVEPTSQFIISNVHNPSVKPLPNNIIPQFTLEDENFSSVNTKPYKNSYYTIFPNM